MNILYIATEMHLKKDLEWFWYIDSQKEKDKLDRYKNQCEKLIIISPYEKNICMKNQKDLIKIGNIHSFKENKIELNTINDLYTSKFSAFDIKLRNNIKYTIRSRIYALDVDTVIISAKDNFYQRIAIKMCKKYNKKYAIE